MFGREGEFFPKFHGASCGEDIVRVQTLAEICLAGDGLVAPHVISSDLAAQIICYEFLGGLSPVLRLEAGDRPRFLELGRQLAALHAMPLPIGLSGQAAWGLRELIAFGLGEGEAKLLVSEMPVGFFHGDCWHGNLFVRGDQFVILDPIPVGILFDRPPLVANGAFDLATLHMSLYARQPLMRYFFNIGMRVECTANDLLLGYLGKERLSSLGPVIEKLSFLLADMWQDGLSRRLAPPVASLKRKMIKRAVAVLRRGSV